MLYNILKLLKKNGIFAILWAFKALL